MAVKRIHVKVSDSKSVVEMETFPSSGGEPINEKDATTRLNCTLSLSHQFADPHYVMTISIMNRSGPPL